VSFYVLVSLRSKEARVLRSVRKFSIRYVLVYSRRGTRVLWEGPTTVRL
jgi:hypothetical protein